MIKSIFVIYHRNQRSINLKYDVFGKSSFTDARSDTKTNKAVTVPMNLSEKFSISMNKVEYAKENNRAVGKNVFNI